ncbi:MAG TPA: hypothetical protein VEA80_02095 [Vitreimonas sp.]|uniref:hypothetical protein n=1 Tax=Vitreimonas sp. TaxID=3069702 RepID=UPI002D5E9215|nr:hypothetical protein [Vitreimonas sp.]HYD86242.1 hypothetical protein [Vitreimonas sp.]
MESDRFWAVKYRLLEYVKSPSLKHIRDPQSVNKLAKEILTSLDQASSVWRKWDGVRDDVAKAAAYCWIPVEGLRAFLNQLPGPELTITDVNQRLRAIWEETTSNGYPNEDVKDACLALYEMEQAAGTEMMAIIGALQEFIEAEEERLRVEGEARYKRLREEEQARLEQMFLAGADSPWIKVGQSKDLFCRKNGRAFRIAQGKDKRWSLFRIANVDDAGKLLGVYGTRGDANKALKTIAYEVEPRW